jgi:hypothetical protein
MPARIEIGQRYRKTDGAWQVWQVVEVGPVREGIRYYRLAEVKDPSNIKLLSEHTLTDSRSYRPTNRSR